MKTVKTQLSKELAKIRIDYEITRAQMAKDLKISDKELASIEAGKSEITYSFLKTVADRYSEADEVGETLLESLQIAFMKSATAITFKLSELDEYQRMRVLELQSQIEAENAIANAQAEEERRRQKQQRAEERLAKKAAKNPTEETQVMPDVDTSATIENEMSDDEVINSLNSSLDEEYGSVIGILQELDELNAA